MGDDCLHRFLLDDLDICGAVVRLGSVWRKMLDDRNYAAPVARLLGELSATTLLLGASLKQAGRLTIQLRGSGPISLLVIDCNERLAIRGMAKCAEAPPSERIADLLGHGQLLLSLDQPSMREPYQSIVPLGGETLAEVFEHYLRQSDQSPARLFLAASTDAAGGLLLQKLPTADQRDADGWGRVEALATTVRTAELLTLPAEELLLRLFPEEAVRLFPARPIAHNCPEDWAKVRALLRSLGPSEAYAALRETGEVVVRDDLCNREYRFDRAAIDELFRDFTGPSASPPTIH
ncbi:Hsp33 family molecular chaperone HslO [Accumulibacter sp.]|uniref:Hsp33 family molecular chaperone HslO n=1 Tax=Accumulibacter sp. TaxID=2053492 RepID=UPI0025EABF3D|nr:Hsp33 family molecular chaperone HslO [Accumulibacter sp.]MCM8596109.1 Hsp33 family molecular chaperone HslO [Accumulibacter sp.]MDS4050258.1 Hsp33 family molecular chaperone HslO [Accumulibacter sp.]